MEAGRRHRFIAAEGSDSLAALCMPKQATTPGGFLQDMRFELVHVPFSAVELGGDCADSRKRKILPRTGTAYRPAALSNTAAAI